MLLFSVVVVPELVVIGCPSLDRLEVAATTVEAPGGAGFNTALAARALGRGKDAAGGLEVGLVAVFPTQVPASIGAAFGPGGLRREGITVRIGALPHFDIAYDAQQQAHYRTAAAGLEATLTPHDVPEAWLAARHIHVGPLAASSARQLDMAATLRERGFVGTLSAGGFQADIDADQGAAEQLERACDVFFCNRAELELLYPHGHPTDASTHICVTEGRSGVTVISDGSSTHFPPLPADVVVDPTGAGDAFCGGYLAGLLHGTDAVESGQRAAVIALGGHGSTALVEAVSAGMGPRAQLATDRIEAVAARLSGSAATSELDFCGFPFPARDEPWALDCLAVATVHQYGFWYDDEQGWTEPMFAMGGARRWKGSDYIWQAFTRAAATDPSVVSLERLATEPDLFDDIVADDSGTNPVPESETHAELQMSYARHLLASGFANFGEVVARVTTSATPAHAFLDVLATVPGFAEDPLAKKANLLAIMLAGRPERFLELTDAHSITPIIDYHLMRSCLRTECVRIIDPDLRRRLTARAWVDAAEEDEIRRACFDAVNLLVARSGLSQAAVDGFFFSNARAHCIETSAPSCDDCPLEPACGQAVELFQPVIRTTAY